MPRTTRAALLALVVPLVLALAVPAEARPVPSSRRRQAQARAKRAALAVKIDALRASDTDLEGAVRALDAQLATQLAAAQSSRQGAKAAGEALAEAQRRLEGTTAEAARLKALVVRRAVEAYVSPRPPLLSAVVSSRDLAEATRKESFLEQVVQDDHSLLDRLRAREEDLAGQRAVLRRARDLYVARRRHADRRSDAVRRARRQQGRLRTALSQRVREYLAEADAVGRQEVALTALIRWEQAAAAEADARAARAAQTAAASVARARRALRPPEGRDDGRVSGAGLIWPVRGPVTSGFGRRWGRLHAGIDIGAARGVAIHAAKAGTVVYSGTMSGYGNVVVIDHGGGLTTLYAHQSRRAVGDGQRVAQGAVIGYVGSTGHSTGPHLHFETRVGARPQNPLRFLP